ncbi:MAG: spore germination protein [Tumebacillaceae bacterium]
MVHFIKPRKVKELKQAQVLEERFEEKMETVTEDDLVEQVAVNIDRLRKIFGESNDLVIREFSYDLNAHHKAALVYLDGMISSQVVDDQILKSLMLMMRDDRHAATFTVKGAASFIKQYVMPIAEADETTSFRAITRCVLAGDTALLLDGCRHALMLNAKGFEKRAVQEPSTESVVRGPRDGFTETLRVNTALIRRRIKDPDLRVKSFTVGRRSNTDVALLYLEGVADDGVVQEVSNRIEQIDVGSIFEGGYIEQYIEDNHWSPFPLIQNTERPDKVAANLMEGKVAIIVDGSPYVLIAPAVFQQFYQSPEDYYERPLIATLVRFIRVLSMLIALLLPSFYIAFSSFHPEMIPSKLVIAMAAGRATVPFPSVIEALAMEISIEILREASIRLPGPIGPTIGIVGALIVGEAAVRAGIVSPIMVIVVALTTIGSFVAPSYNAAIAMRMLRFPIMLLAAAFGLYGIMLFVIVIVIHLCSLKSFGVPYLAPYTPVNLLTLGDSVVRIPLYRMTKRPNLFVNKEARKQVNPASAEDVMNDKQKQPDANQSENKPTK